MTNDNVMNKTDGSADFIKILTAGGKVNKYAFLFGMVAITVTTMIMAIFYMEREVGAQLIYYHMMGHVIYLHICSCIFIYRQFKESKGNIKSIKVFAKPYCEDYMKAYMLSGVGFILFQIAMASVAQIVWTEELGHAMDISSDMIIELLYFNAAVLFSFNFIQPKLLGWFELDFYEFGWPRPKNNS